MKLLLASDLHLHPFSQFGSIDANGMNSRLVDGLNVVYQMRTVCEQRNIDRVLILGDVFHDRTRIPVTTLHGAWQAFQSLREVAMIWMLVGNHDLGSRCENVHSLAPFSLFCHVVDTPRCQQFGSREFHFIPHIPDVANLRRAIQDCKSSVLCLHQPIREGLPSAAMGDGDFCLKDIPDHVELVLAGDIHKRGFVGDKFFYCGSPLQLNFGEREEQKGFTILDSDTLAMEFVESDAPKFVLFECFEDGPDPLTLDIEASQPGRNFVKLSYNYKWKAEAAEIKDRYPRIVLESQGVASATLSRVSADVLSSDYSLLAAYVDQVDSSVPNKEQVLRFGLDILSIPS